MPTTSLLILLVVAIWAVYLLQHWIRRREALATARSVDRFSEAMRVLATRDPLPRGMAPMVRGRSSERHQAPQVSVKAPRTSLRAGHHTVGDDMNNDQRDDNTKVGLQQRIGPVVATGRGLVAKVARLNGRQVRGISLLAALGFTALTLLLALFGAASWWLPLLGVLAVAGLVVWLRREALAAARAREAARPTRAPRRVVRVDSVASAAVATGTESDTDTGSEKITAKANEVYGFEAPADTAAPTASVADQVVTADAAGPLEDTDGWAPTAVPRPTYAMKERAPQTEVAPAATVAAQPVSVDDLPFDGLALDEDLEELPAVYRAG